MEFEFDKEIDALLRSSQSGDTRPNDAIRHLDADAISLFAENALPEAARREYVSHFADCGRCRRILSDVISLGAADDATEPHQPIVEVPENRATPWYVRLFRGPQLAALMGAVVLAFSGLLGYMVYQSSSADRASEVTMSANSGTAAGESATDEHINVTSSENIASNASAVSAPSNLNRPVANQAGSQGELPAVSGTPAPAQEMMPSAAEPETSILRADTPSSPPTPAPKREQQLAKDGDDRDAKQTDVAESQPIQRAEDKTSLKSRTAGPSGANAKKMNSPPVPRSDSGVTLERQRDTAGERRVGGRVFRQRGGIWYDTSYSGQSLINIRRGSENYLRLDKDLRTIAESFQGTVVVVWSAKAYRIQ